LITEEDFQDDQKCLDYFHRFQTIRKLQQVRESISAEDFEAVFKNFDSIKNSGYTLEEVISTSTEQLIDRDGYLHDLAYRQEADDDAEESELEGDNDVGNDDEEEEEEEVWEELPEAMNRAVETPWHGLGQQRNKTLPPTWRSKNPISRKKRKFGEKFLQK
jgi:hypothetical protein